MRGGASAVAGGDAQAARRLCIGLLASAALLGCARHVGGPSGPHALPDGVFRYAVARNEPYTPPSWPRVVAADVFVPEAAGPLPAVLLVHGGRWESGSRADTEGIARQLAEAGFVVVNADYRLAPAFRFPAPLHDLQQAVRWMRANAGRFRIDPERIGAFGYSSGGHLVSLLATVGGDDRLAAPHGGPDTRLGAVVSGGTPADLRLYGSGRGCPEFLGGTAMELPDIHALASPVTHITPDDPPVFLYHGSLDDIVPIEQAEAMLAALTAAGVPAELHIVRGAGHIALAMFSRPVVAEAIHFLDRRLRKGGSGTAPGAFRGLAVDPAAGRRNPAPESAAPS